MQIHGIPDKELVDKIVAVSIDVPGGADGLPGNLRMSLPQALWQSSAGLGDDLQRPRGGVKMDSGGDELRLRQARHQIARKNDIVEDFRQQRRIGVRTQRSRRAPRWAARAGVAP